MDKLKSTIESILFAANKPLSAKSLAKLLEGEADEILKTLQAIADDYKERGVVLLQSGTGGPGDLWQFSTNAKNSTEIKKFLNAELREKLTDASVETLAIIAYRQPISRTEIEAIRGVNCQYSLRHLLIRGLVQKIPNPNDSRQLLYETTIEFLQHIGLKSTAELENFEKLTAKIKLPANEIREEAPKPVEEN